MTDLTISYKGNAILAASESLSRKLDTLGHYCEDDITIEYTRPTFSTQSKTVSPTTSVQTITPDSGYDGLSSVIVRAMTLYTGALRGE